MRKARLGLAAVALGLFVGAPALPAQEKEHTEVKTKQTGAGPNTTSKSEWVAGTVKEYEAGKSIKISGPNDKTYSFDLDNAARVEGVIVVGQPAKVGYSKGSDGVERVTVVSAASPSAQAGTTAPRAHVETETRQSVPGPDLKTKSEVVVGTVKAYEPGKSIKVVGPAEKDYSFDLEEGVSLRGVISVGERVRVTYTKVSNGERVTTIEVVKGRG
jgi:hypothetical protein